MKRKLTRTNCPGSCSVHRRSIQGFLELRSVLELLNCLCIGEPSALALVLLGPLVQLLYHGALVKVVAGAVLGRLGRSLLLKVAQVIVNVERDARFLPGLSLGRLLARLIRLPSSLGQDPALAPGGLNEDDVVAVCAEWYDAGDKSFSLRVVP